MHQDHQTLPNLDQIKEVLSFLPALTAENFSPVKSWKDGWPEYEPVVRDFFRTLSQTCWSDFSYSPAEAGQMLSDKTLIRTASLAQVKTMLTCCLRAERFSDGSWEAVIRNNAIRRLLERLDEIRAEMESN